MAFESRPFLARVPDQSLIASEAGEGTHHVQATRDIAGSYALVYLPAYPALPAQAGSETTPSVVAENPGFYSHAWKPPSITVL